MDLTLEVIEAASLDRVVRAIAEDADVLPGWVIEAVVRALSRASGVLDKSHYGVGSGDVQPGTVVPHHLAPHAYVASDDFLCGCGGLESDARHHGSGAGA